MTSSVHSLALAQENAAFFGGDVHRPECLRADHDRSRVSDSRGGVARLDQAGRSIVAGARP